MALTARTMAKTGQDPKPETVSTLIMRTTYKFCVTEKRSGKIEDVMHAT